jgi:hypothetical protein
MSEIITIGSGVNGFAENKDQAKELRATRVLPALASDVRITLDFAAVRYATQSFVHALIGEALQKYGEHALDQIEFRNCSEAVRSVIELVVDYSLGGFVEKRGA